MVGSECVQFDTELPEYRTDGGVHGKDSNDPRLAMNLPKFRRAMFTVGLLIRHFDFGKEEIYKDLTVSS